MVELEDSGSLLKPLLLMFSWSLAIPGYGQMNC